MEELAQALQQEYGWRLDPGWSNNDIDVFYQVGRDMQQCIQELAGADGAAWIRHCFGPARIRKGSLINQLIQRNFVLPSLDVWLLPGTVRQIIVHELAHVLDNALKEGGSLPATFTGGGPADALIRALGGRPRGLRFFNGSCDLPPQHRWRVDAGGGYGNHSTADYFAEAFAWLVYDPSKLPNSTVRDWMIDFVRSH